MAGLEFAHSTREYLTDCIEFADQKSAAVIAFATTILGALCVGVHDMVTRDVAGQLCTNTLLALSALPAAVCATAAAWWALDAQSPRRAQAYESLASYVDITKQHAAYRTSILELDEQGAAGEYATHCAVLARIVDAKFAAIGRAMHWLRRLLFGGSLFAVVYVGIALYSATG